MFSPAARTAAYVGFAAALASLSGCFGSKDSAVLILLGEQTTVFDGSVTTWAVQRGNGVVDEMGATISMTTIQNAPTTFPGGPGPAGAVAVLKFPESVRGKTFIDHFELHWEPHGHPPLGIFDKPHWDFHFYSIPEAQVRLIEPNASALPRPAAVPSGWLNAANDDEYLAQVVPQMGFHSLESRVLDPGYVFDHTLIFGYWKGQNIFVEPMITKAWFEKEEDRQYSQAIPVPPGIPSGTRYPTRLEVRYASEASVYTITFKDFVTVP